MGRLTCCCKRKLARSGSSLRLVSGNFVVPNGVYNLKVWVQGGGAGGNDIYIAGPAVGSGSSGSAGGMAYRQIPVTPGQIFPYTVGATVPRATNGNLSTITINGFTLTANGGNRGFNGSTATPQGGTATGGSANIKGGNGAPGNNTGNTPGGPGGAIGGADSGGLGAPGTQANDFQGYRAALALITPAITIFGVAPAGFFPGPPTNGAQSVGFGNSGSGTSAGPSTSAGAGREGSGGGSSSANNTSNSVGGPGSSGFILISW